jgi:hypothetical protein
LNYWDEASASYKFVYSEGATFFAYSFYTEYNFDCAKNEALEDFIFLFVSRVMALEKMA